MDPRGQDGAWLPALLQLSDSALPIGAYAHSLGFEGMVQLGAIHDAAGLERFLQRELLGSFAEVDLPLFRLSREALAAGDFDALTRLDQLSWAARPTAELRSASGRMGRQLVALSGQFLGEVPDDWPKVEAALVRRQAVTVSAALHHFRGIPISASLPAIAWQALTGVAQAGLKLLHLGPSAIQGILARSGEAVASAVAASLLLGEDEIGSFTPLWDIASSRHERAEARLFIS